MTDTTESTSQWYIHIIRSLQTWSQEKYKNVIFTRRLTSPEFEQRSQGFDKTCEDKHKLLDLTVVKYNQEPIQLSGFHLKIKQVHMKLLVCDTVLLDLVIIPFNSVCMQVS